jgi:hypothetical protein
VLSFSSQQIFCLSHFRRIKLHKTLITLAAAAALGCVPMATNALAASHPDNHANARHSATGQATGRHSMAGYARGSHVARYGIGYRHGSIYNGPIYNGPVYDSCPGYGPGYGYGYGGCPGYGGVVGGLIGGVLGGYRPY